MSSPLTCTPQGNDSYTTPQAQLDQNAQRQRTLPTHYQICLPRNALRGSGVILSHCSSNQSTTHLQTNHRLSRCCSPIPNKNQLFEADSPTERASKTSCRTKDRADARRLRITLVAQKQV